MTMTAASSCSARLTVRHRQSTRASPAATASMQQAPNTASAVGAGAAPTFETWPNSMRSACQVSAALCGKALSGVSSVFGVLITYDPKSLSTARITSESGMDTTAATRLAASAVRTRRSASIRYRQTTTMAEMKT